jgi:hypothetical protein
VGRVIRKAAAAVTGANNSDVMGKDEDSTLLALYRAFSPAEPATPVLSVQVTATGTAPATPIASLSSKSMSFASQMLGTTSLPQTVQPSDIGTGAMSITIAVAGVSNKVSVEQLEAGGSTKAHTFLRLLRNGRK